MKSLLLDLIESLIFVYQTLIFMALSLVIALLLFFTFAVFLPPAARFAVGFDSALETVRALEFAGVHFLQTRGLLPAGIASTSLPAYSYLFEFVSMAVSAPLMLLCGLRCVLKIERTPAKVDQN